MAEPAQIEAEPGSGTGAGMLAFLDYAIRRNEIVEASGLALRTGVRRVLDTDETFLDQDIRTMDLEEVARRFWNKQRGKVKDASLTDYEKRFRQTVEMYRKWLAQDPSWRPAPRKATVLRQSKSDNGTNPRAQRTATTTDEPAAMETVTQAGNDPKVQMVTYPYPVRPGLLAQVLLPADLTAREAERVAKFVASLAFDERLAITAGPTDSP